MEKVNFNNILEDITSQYPKIKQEDYLDTGNFPIIDQGKTFIGGYTNEIIEDNNPFLPIIIFGDHTKVIKYVDFPFCIGADGIKVLNVNKEIAYPKYIFYYLKSIELCDAGYSRHFKFLKEIQIPLPLYEEQIKIANLLEKIENLIAERQNTIDLLDELIKTTFYQMFGDPVKNEKGWEKDEIGKFSESIVPGRDKPKSFTGNIPWITTDKLRDLSIISKKNFKLGLTNDEISSAKSKIIPSQSILMTCVGNLGIVSVIEFDCVANQQLHSYQCGDSLNNVFTMFCLSFSKSFMYRMASTTTVPYMNKTICNSIPVIIPPIDLQNKFAAFAQKTETIKAEKEAQKKMIEELYSSISQKAFTGELDLSKVTFDAALLPKESEVKEVEKIIKEKSKGEKLVKHQKTKEKEKPIIPPIAKNWNQLSFKEIAEAIKAHFQEFYFNSEMLVRYLVEDLDINVDYFSSAEQKKNLQLENANDFLQFVSGAITGDNPFLNLEQVFYNAQTENITNIRFKEQDLELLKPKTTKDRSGIYFRINHEATTN